MFFKSHTRKSVTFVPERKQHGKNGISVMEAVPGAAQEIVKYTLGVDVIMTHYTRRIISITQTDGEVSLVINQ